MPSPESFPQAPGVEKIKLPPEVLEEIKKMAEEEKSKSIADELKGKESDLKKNTDLWREQN